MRAWWILAVVLSGCAEAVAPQFDDASAARIDVTREAQRGDDVAAQADASVDHASAPDAARRDARVAMDARDAGAATDVIDVRDVAYVWDAFVAPEQDPVCPPWMGDPVTDAPVLGEWEDPGPWAPCAIPISHVLDGSEQHLGITSDAGAACADGGTGCFTEVDSLHVDARTGVRLWWYTDPAWNGHVSIRRRCDDPASAIGLSESRSNNAPTDSFRGFLLPGDWYIVLEQPRAAQRHLTFGTFAPAPNYDCGHAMVLQPCVQYLSPNAGGGAYRGIGNSTSNNCIGITAVAFQAEIPAGERMAIAAGNVQLCGSAHCVTRDEEGGGEAFFDGSGTLGFLLPEPQSGLVAYRTAPPLAYGHCETPAELSVGMTTNQNAGWGQPRDDLFPHHNPRTLFYTALVPPRTGTRATATRLDGSQRPGRLAILDGCDATSIVASADTTTRRGDLFVNYTNHSDVERRIVIASADTGPIHAEAFNLELYEAPLDRLSNVRPDTPLALADGVPVLDQSTRDAFEPPAACVASGTPAPPMLFYAARVPAGHRGRFTIEHDGENFDTHTFVVDPTDACPQPSVGWRSDATQITGDITNETLADRVVEIAVSYGPADTFGVRFDDLGAVAP